MLNPEKDILIEQLRKLSVDLVANFEETLGAAKLKLDNTYGKGTIKSFSIAKGLSLRTYNITFKEEINFTITEKEKKSLFLIFCLQGHYHHKFGNEELSTKIVKMQNVILASGTEVEHHISLPANVKLQISVIHIYRNELDIDEYRKNLSLAIEDIFVNVDENKPYKFLGPINPATAEFVNLIFENNTMNVVGRLILEAAIMNTMASQLQNHDDHKTGLNFDAPLKKTELDRIIEVCNYIDLNLTGSITLADLEKFSGMHKKKLQKGFRYLFGQNVNAFVQNVRFKKAKELLQTTDFTISEIVYSIGLENRSYFSKSFQDRFGLSPRDYKKQFEGKDVIFELSYKSKTAFGLPKTAVDDIVKVSRINNEKFDITGCLVCFNSEFFQILEGPKKNVLAIYDKIVKDTRHTDVTLLWKGPKYERIFEDWNLGYISQSGIFHNQPRTPSMSINLSEILSEFPGSGITSRLFWIQLKNMIKVYKISE